MKELKLIKELAGTAYELVENHLVWLHVKCAVCGRELILDDPRRNGCALAALVVSLRVILDRPLKLPFLRGQLD